MYTESNTSPQRPRHRFGLTAKFVTPVTLLALFSIAVILGLWALYVRFNVQMGPLFPLLLLLGLVLVGLALAGLGLLINRRILRPLRALQAGVTRLAAGELGYHLDLATGDEFQDLADEFNRMSANLKQLQEEVLASAEEKERLAVEAQSRVREISSLLEAGRAITSLDLDSVLGVLAREAAAAARADECAIYLLDVTGQHLAPRGTWSAAPPEDGGTLPAVAVGDGPIGWVAQQGQSLLLNGTQARARFGLAGGTGTLGAILSLPLDVDGRTVGVLHATSHGLDTFKPADERLLSAFADQAAVAVQNAQLFEEERRRARELAVINQINRTITASLDLEHMFAALLSALGDLIPHDLAQITLWEPERGLLRTRARSGEPRYMAGREDYAPGEGVPGEVLKRRASLAFADLQRDPETSPKLDTGLFPVRSAIGVLLSAGDEVIGTLDLASMRPGAFTAQHVTTLETLAGQAAVAIQNARLFDERQRRLRELDGLHEVSQAVSALTDPAEVYAQLTQRIARLMDVEICGVLLHEPESATLVAQQPFFGMPEQLVPIYHLSVAPDGPLYPLWSEAGFWMSNNVEEDEAAAACGLREIAQAGGLRRTLLVPMQVGPHKIGAIQAANKRNGREFTEEDARLLAIFAAQAAALVENSRLFSETRRGAEEATGLARIATRCASELNLDELLKHVMAETALLLGAEIGIMLLWDSAHRDLLVQHNALHGIAPELLPILRLSADEPDFQYVISRTRRVFLSNNVPTDKRILTGYRRIAEQLAVQNGLGVPLVAGDHSLGEILWCNRPGGFGEEGVRLASTITPQFALAIERAQLFAETQRRVAELEVLRQIGQSLSATLDLDQLLAALYEQTRRVMFADNFYVALYDPGQDEVHFAFYMSRGERRADGGRRRGGNGLTEYVIRTREPLLVRGDVAEHVRTLGVDPVGPDARAWLGVPMITGDRVLGILSAQSYVDEASFDEGHLHLLQSIAAQAAIAIENARLYKLTDASLRHRVDQLTALTRIGRELNVTLHREDILRLVLDEALRTTGATCGSISLREGQAGEFKTVLCRNCPPETVEEEALDRAVIADVRSCVVTDYAAAPAATPAHAGVRSTLAVPIYYEQSVIGLVHLHAAHAGTFDPGAVEFVEAIAAQAAIAAGNAERFRETMVREGFERRRAEQIARLFEISQAFRSNRSLQEILEEAAYAIQETLGFAAVVVSLLETDADGVERLRRVAGAGIPLSEWEQLAGARHPWAVFEALLQDEFRISQSYYIPFEAQRDLPLEEQIRTFNVVPAAPGQEREPGRWHPDDLLLTPLRGGAGSNLGLISLDEPRDGAIPSRAVVEVLEIFANQAAAAIENARLFTALQGQHAATVTERDRLAQLHLTTLEVQRTPDLSGKLRAIAAGIRAAGWNRVLITLRDEHLEPLELISAGLSTGEEEVLRGQLSSGAVWRQRLSDPRLERFRLGRAYYFPGDVAEARAILTGSSVQVPSAPKRRDIPDAWDPNDGIYLPLYGPDNQALGILTLDDPADGRRPTEASLRPIELFAQQAAHAVGSARLEEAEKRRAAQLAVIADIGRRMSAMLNLDAIFSALVESVQQTFRQRSAMLLLADEDTGDTLSIRAMAGTAAADPSLQDFRLPLTRGIIGRAARSGHTQVVQDTSQDPDYFGEGLAEAVSELAVPVKLAGRVLGVINVDADRVNAFDEGDVAALETLADQAAVAIENARLFEETTLRARQLAATQSVTATVNAGASLQSVLPAVLAALRDLARVDALTVALFRPDGLRLALLRVTTAAFNRVNVSEQEYRADSTLGRAIDSRQPLLLARLEEERERFADVPELLAAGLRCYVALPLMLGERVTGAIGLGSKSEAAFGPRELQPFAQLSGQLASAAERSRLFEETDRRLAQQTVLHEAATGIASSLDPDAILHKVAEQMVRLVHATSLRYYTWDETYDVLTVTAEYTTAEATPAEQVGVRGQQWPARELPAVARALAERQPQPRAAGRMPANSPEALAFEAWGGRSLLCVPLVTRGHALGCFELRHSREEHAYSGEDLRLLQALASQAGVGLENARLFQETGQRVDELATITHLGQVIGSTVKMDELLELLREHFAKAFATDSFYVALYDAARHEISFPLMVDRNEIRNPQPLRSDTGISAYILRTRQPLLLHSRAELERLPVRHAGETAESYLGVPMTAGDRLAGVVAVQSYDRANLFSESHLRILSAVAAQLAVSIENAQLYESEQQRRRFAEAMREAAETVSSTLDVAEVLERLLDHLRRVVDYDTASIQLLRGEELVIIGGRGFDDLGAVLGLQFPIAGDNPNRVVMERRRPVIYDDVQEHYAIFRTEPHNHVHGWLGVPLLYGDELLGMIAIDSRQPGYFREEQAQQALIFANQAAVALQNARLFQETMDREQFAEALGRVALAINATLDLPTVLDLIAQEMLLIFGVDGALVFLQRGEDLTVITAQGEWRERYLGTRIRAGDSRSLCVRALQERRPIFINHVSQMRDRWVELKPQDDIQSAMAVPLIGQRSTGVLLLLDARRADHFLQADVEKATVAGTQAVLAIENARLFSEARTRAEQLATLNEIARVVSGGLDLVSMLEAIYQRLPSVLPLDVFYVALYDPMTDSMVYPLMYDGGERYEQTPLPLNRAGLTARTMETRQTQMLLRTPEELGALPVTNMRLGNRARPSASLLFAPLVVENEAIGVLSVQSYLLDAYTPDHSNLLVGVANQTALAIRNARLFQQIQEQSLALQRRVDELAVFNELGRVISATLDLDALMRALHYQVGRLMDAASFYVSLYDAGLDELYEPYGVDAGVPQPPAWRKRSGLAGHIVTTCEPLLLRTATDRVALADIPVIGTPSKCYLGVPLIYSDQVIGVMAVQSYDVEYAYDEDDQRILTAVAHQAAIAVENARLYAASRQHAEAIEERAQRLALVNRVSSVLSSTLNEQEVLDVVVRELGRAIGAEQCRFVLFEPDKGYGRVRAELVSTAGIENVRIPMETDVVFREREPVAVSDLAADERMVDVRDQLMAAGVQSVLMVPVAVRDEIIGSIGLDILSHRREFTPGEIELAQTLGNQAGVSLQNARLFEQIRRFTQELEQRVQERTEELARANRELLLERDRIDTLFRITAELASSLDLDRVLNRALELIVEAVGATQGRVLLLNRETNTLWCRAALGRQDTLPPGGEPTPFKRGEGLGGWVMRHREPAIISDLHEDSRWTALPGSRPTYRSALAVPLGTEEPLGVLMLGHPQTDYFTESELRLVSAAASQVTSAIANAELYGLIREQAERLGMMLRAQQTEAARSQAILEGVADGVMVAGPHGEITLFNAAAERILDLKRSTVLGRSAGEFIGVYGRAGRTLAEATDRWLHDPSSYRGEFLAERLDLEQRVVSVHIAPVLMGEEYLGTVSVFRDITKEVEVDRMKSEFVSTVSHELRTPMTSIKGYADLLLLGAGGPVPDAQRRFLDVIKTNADRLSALVNDLLDISRIETGRVELDLQLVQLQEVVAQVVANLRGRARQENKDIEVVADVAEDLPEVHADHDRLTQVLMNLVDNAFNYTPPGGTITVSAHRQGTDWVRTSVKDTGIGIPPEDIDKIFERFFRGDDPAVQVVSGTGLGLAIVNQLVEMHGGTLSVESAGRGMGSTFSFTMPIHGMAEGDGTPAQAAPAAAS